MSSSTLANPDAGSRTFRVSRSTGLVICLAALGFIVLLSISVGAKAIPLSDAWVRLLSPDGSYDSNVIHTVRLPRTVTGLVVGVALGLAGALMQALTRNPLADPGILGVNAGSFAGVAFAVSVLGIATPAAFVWFAFLGAAGASIVVYLLGSLGRGQATPVRLALAGMAIGASLTAITSAMVIVDPEAFDRIRFWAVGSLAVTDTSVVYGVLPFVVVGVGIALLLAKPLNAIALGEEMGAALGTNINRTRLLTALSVTLLCGAAVAAAGPIGFIGLTVPHIARAIVGPDQRWVLPYTVVLAPILLLGADIIGRVVVRPEELQTGIVTAIVGAPVFIYLVRRRRMAQL